MWDNVWPNWITLQGRQGEPGGEGQPGHPGMPGFKGSKVRLHYQVIFFSLTSVTVAAASFLSYASNTLFNWHKKVSLSI